MGVFDFFAGVAVRTESRVPPVAPNVSVRVDTPDSSETQREWFVRDCAVRDGELWGVTCMIEYRDSQGAESCRRITLREIAAKNAPEGPWYLHCMCHERRALRTFRLDRIAAVIDLDGVVYAPPDFFIGELRCDIPPSIFGRSGTMKKAVRQERPGTPQRRVAKAGLRVLCALSRADGVMSPEEVCIALDYVSARAAMDGVPMGEDDRLALTGYVRRQFPSQDVLWESLSDLDAESDEAKRLFMRHAVRLIEADGTWSPEEFDLVERVKEAIL